jgi:hypothetical protein
MSAATLLRKLRADPDVIEAQVIDGKVRIRLRHGAGSDAHDRVAVILFGRAPKVRRMPLPAPPRPSRRSTSPQHGGKAA